jgi:hypothetical protein
MRFLKHPANYSFSTKIKYGDETIAMVSLTIYFCTINTPLERKSFSILNAMYLTFQSVGLSKFDAKHINGFNA